MNTSTLPPPDPRNLEPPTIDQLIELEVRIADEIQLLKEELNAAKAELEESTSTHAIGGSSRHAPESLDEVSATSMRLREERLHLLEAALESMDAGLYGECEVCRESIPWARLDAQPEALTCTRCGSV